jgi:hypothetical protein
MVIAAEDKNSEKTNRVTSTLAPFPFEFVEKQLQKKNFGIFTTVSSEGKPHSVGVVYSMSPIGQPFALYLITRSVLKKAKNLQNNSNVSFVVPFPRILFRNIPPACIQFQGKAETISADDPIAMKAFQSSMVLRRSMLHSKTLGQCIFVKIVPDAKIFCFGIGVSIWDFLIRSRSMNLKSLYVRVPPNR